MTEVVKEAVKLAEKELKEKEISNIKMIAKAILEEIKTSEEKKKVEEDRLRVLKKDLENLKEGRIDLIKERQEIDKQAKDISIIIVKERVIEKQVSPWYVPWIIELKPQYNPTYYFNGLCGTSQTIGDFTGGYIGTSLATDSNYQITNSTAHMYTSGTYLLSDGTIKYI